MVPHLILPIDPYLIIHSKDPFYPILLPPSHLHSVGALEVNITQTSTETNHFDNQDCKTNHLTKIVAHVQGQELT